jgi:hypothetical protein
MVEGKHRGGIIPTPLSHTQWGLAGERGDGIDSSQDQNERIWTEITTHNHKITIELIGPECKASSWCRKHLTDYAPEDSNHPAEQRRKSWVVHSVWSVFTKRSGRVLIQRSRTT